MRHQDFVIGTEFFTGSGRWRCTDIGTRVIVAIQLNARDPSWYNGPPYAVAEMAFDEYDLEGCSLDPTEFNTPPLRTRREAPAPFVFCAFVGDGWLEQTSPRARDVLAALRREDALREAVIRPANGADTPSLNISCHGERGYVVQVFEHEQSLSNFAVTSREFSEATVEMELGGLALEHWPPELFIPEQMAETVVDWFLRSGSETPEVAWVGSSQFPRHVIWDDAQGRREWESAVQRSESRNDNT